MYWIYDIPTWAFGLLTVGTFVVLACAGLILFRATLRHRFRLSDDTNEAVNTYFSGVGVFYGLLLGLVAVATWQNYEDVSGLVSKEAAALGALYRDVSSYPEPYRGTLQGELRAYATFVIAEDWPAQRRGQLLIGGTLLIDKVQQALLAFQPSDQGQAVLHAEAFRAFNHLVEARRMRVDAVGTGLPAVLWTVVLIGAGLSVFVTFFLYIPDVRLHLAMTGTLAMFIGLMVFMTAVVDNPFRGEVGVSSDTYRLILDGMMNRKLMIDANPSDEPD